MSTARYDLVVSLERNMANGGYATLAYVLFLATAHAFAGDPTDSDSSKFEHKLKQIAGSEAVDCGRVRSYQEPYPAAICANDQLLMKHAFIMSYHYEWRNVSFHIGFGADSKGNLYRLDFENHNDYFFDSVDLGLRKGGRSR